MSAKPRKRYNNNHSQAYDREDHDSIISAPESIGQDTTDPGSDVHPERVELDNKVRDRTHLSKDKLTVRIAKDFWTP